jgi:hypothetical protein
VVIDQLRWWYHLLPLYHRQLSTTSVSLIFPKSFLTLQLYISKSPSPRCGVEPQARQGPLFFFLVLASQPARGETHTKPDRPNLLALPALPCLCRALLGFAPLHCSALRRLSSHSNPPSPLLSSPPTLSLSPFHLRLGPGRPTSNPKKTLPPSPRCQDPPPNSIPRLSCCVAGAG